MSSFDELRVDFVSTIVFFGSIPLYFIQVDVISAACLKRSTGKAGIWPAVIAFATNLLSSLVGVFVNRSNPSYYPVLVVTYSLLALAHSLKVLAWVPGDATKNYRRAKRLVILETLQILLLACALVMIYLRASLSPSLFLFCVQMLFTFEIATLSFPKAVCKRTGCCTDHDLAAQESHD
jgi:hypothetical protein